MNKIDAVDAHTDASYLKKKWRQSVFVMKSYDSYNKRKKYIKNRLATRQKSWI